MKLDNNIMDWAIKQILIDGDEISVAKPGLNLNDQKAFDVSAKQLNLNLALYLVKDDAKLADDFFEKWKKHPSLKNNLTEAKREKAIVDLLKKDPHLLIEFSCFNLLSGDITQMLCEGMEAEESNLLKGMIADLKKKVRKEYIDVETARNDQFWKEMKNIVVIYEAEKALREIKKQSKEIDPVKYLLNSLIHVYYVPSYINSKDIKFSKEFIGKNVGNREVIRKLLGKLNKQPAETKEALSLLRAAYIARKEIDKEMKKEDKDKKYGWIMFELLISDKFIYTEDTIRKIADYKELLEKEFYKYLKLLPTREEKLKFLKDHYHPYDADKRSNYEKMLLSGTVGAISYDKSKRTEDIKLEIRKIERVIRDENIENMKDRKKIAEKRRELNEAISTKDSEKFDELLLELNNGDKKDRNMILFQTINREDIEIQDHVLRLATQRSLDEGDYTYLVKILSTPLGDEYQEKVLIFFEDVVKNRNLSKQMLFEACKKVADDKEKQKPGEGLAFLKNIYNPNHPEKRTPLEELFLIRRGTNETSYNTGNLGKLRDEIERRKEEARKLGKKEEEENKSTRDKISVKASVKVKIKEGKKEKIMRESKEKEENKRQEEERKEKENLKEFMKMEDSSEEEHDPIDLKLIK